METSQNHRRPGHDVAAAAGCAGGYQRSFSSSLLDAVYRSIDDGCGGRGRQECEGNFSKGAMGRQLVSRPAADERKESTASLQKTAPPRPGSGPVPAAEDHQLQPRGPSKVVQQQHHRHQKQGDRPFAKSTSSSSNSSYGGFSSSDVDKPAAAAFVSTGPQPKPIRTSLPPETRKEKKPPGENNAKQSAKDSIGGRFRGSKLYRELKKAKTPVSPGARLAGFLNTLFMSAGSLKKGKVAGNPAAGGLRKPAGDASLCSSAAASSRSRLGRTPSSTGNAPSSAGGDARRSVRFFPVSFVVDEDGRRHGHRSVYPDQKPECFRSRPRALREAAQSRKPTMDATREFMRWYEEKKKVAHGFRAGAGEVAEAEEDDGAASYSSSDLFELENLPGVGVGGELPVYETTRAAAHGVAAPKK